MAGSRTRDGGRRVRLAAGWARPREWPVLQGLLPLRRDQVPGDLLAGVTLAALGIPEVLGYARIAGMPVVTGLYTLLLPMALFAVFGASRHLVVAADSATAAILAGALLRLADPGSAQYVRLAGLAALITGALLLIARLARLGFLANFLSRTVLLGFLTGVGIQVAIGQLPDMLGVSAPSSHTVIKLVQTIKALPSAQGATVAVVAQRGGGDDGRQPDHPPDPRGADRGGRLDHRQPGGRPGRPRGQRARLHPPRACPPSGCRPSGCTTPSRCWAPRRRSSSSSWPRARPPPARTRPSTTSRSAPTPT